MVECRRAEKPHDKFPLFAGERSGALKSKYPEIGNDRLVC
jgi:hypothetical protein